MLVRALAVTAVVSLGGGAVAASATTAEAPVFIVKGLYAHAAAPARVETLFAADLAQAYRKGAGHPREVGAIDFDWRFGARDVKITDLNVYALPPPPVSAGQPPEVIVAADFHNFGRLRRVFYRFCRAPNQQWRIADVQSRDAPAPWGLRQLLKLDPVRVRC